MCYDFSVVMSITFLTALFFFGLFLGSFLNVLVDRLPTQRPVFFGRSYCENCKKTLAWYDLIPVISFPLLNGKCRYCKTKLSIYYPIIELTTGAMLVLTFLLTQRIYELRFFPIRSGFMNYEYITSLIYYLFITVSLIVIFFSDLKYGIIPDKIVFPAVIITLPYLFLIHNYLFLSHIYSAFGAFLFFLFLFLITKGKGMGIGDIKFAFLIGLILGFPGTLVALYLAFLTGAFFSLILIIWKRKFLKDTIAFGPFLVFGTFISLFWGLSIYHGILRAVGI